jgi:hypothetical protein
MAPSTTYWRRGLRLNLSGCCVAQSTIALKREKINRTFAIPRAPLFSPAEFLRPGRNSRVDPDRGFPAVEAGEGRAAMSNWPLLQVVLNLEGFDLAVFLLSAVVAFIFVGFAVYYISGQQGIGPFWNSVFAALGAYAGLCARDWWLRPYSAHEPYLTIIVVAGGTLTALLAMTAIAQR